MSIMRSGGEIPKVNGQPVPWAGPLPGGGYTGETKKLDKAVMNAAKWLQRLFNHGVEVRFNIDRQSGGAWLKDPKRRNCGVGVGACIKIPDKVRRQRKASIRTGPYKRFDHLWKPDENSEIAWTVYIAQDFLLDPAKADRGLTGHSKYGYWTVGSSREAYAMLKQLADLGKIRAEVAAFVRRTKRLMTRDCPRTL